MGADGDGGGWSEQWRVLIGAAPVVISIVGLTIPACQQVQATRASARVVAATATAEVFERLAAAGRRFEAARAANNEQAMQYEMSYMSARVEIYLVGTADVRDIAGTDLHLIPGGTVRVLATGLPCEGTPLPAGPIFAGRGYPAMGALADEMGVMTCRATPGPGG